MKPYFIKTPFLLKKCYPKRIWDIKQHPQTIYLTFDDGPILGVTDWVLDELKKYNAKATFFCIGKNIKKNPKLFQRIVTEGHSIGNHTNNHMNGWETKPEKYLQNIKKAEKQIQEHLPEGFQEKYVSKKSFRPPYGKMTSKQAKKVLEKGYKIVMWDILSADFDQNNSEEKCISNVLDNAKSGSIIIFHDSKKAEKNMKAALSATLEFFKSEKVQFKAI